VTWQKVLEHVYIYLMFLHCAETH